MLIFNSIKAHILEHFPICSELQMKLRSLRTTEQHVAERRHGSSQTSTWKGVEAPAVGEVGKAARECKSCSAARRLAVDWAMQCKAQGQQVRLQTSCAALHGAAPLQQPEGFCSCRGWLLGRLVTSQVLGWRCIPAVRAGIFWAWSLWALLSTDFQ